MSVKNLNYSLLRRLIVALLACLMLASPAVSAITSKDLQSIINNTPNYGDDAVASSSCSAPSTGSSDSVSLHGSDNRQKAFNYFVDKGLTDVQAAAIVGNFVVESSVIPTADNGSHHGIAQWDYADRYAKLKTYASQSGQDPDSLALQLDFVWLEMQGTPPAGDFSAVLTKLRTYGSADQLDTATTYIQDHYEVAVGQATSDRITAAETIYHDYSGTDSGTVSGTDSSCSSVGAVDCSAANQDNAAGQNNSSASGLSQVRQNVVCLTQGELALWTSGQMKAGHDFFKYSEGRDELWCADFASWIYLKAGYPIGPSQSNWNVASVLGIKDVGTKDVKFHYHAAGSYTPRPGDLVIHLDGESHVNIVVSVNTNNTSMTVVGGDQHGSGGADGNVVNEYTDSSFSGVDGITGYVSPD